ncbi:ComEC/Rec2 family competence protein [Palleronia sp. KMU-117]|uniref:ComEC/Rec2 family competence protein n=1 Tax=Palleronia sp. KMU-117 TaxID=3434108 RepID=UPI003D731B22
MPPGAAILAGLSRAGPGVFDAQRGHLFPWAPVFFGAGIAIYFALARDPTAREWWALGGIAGALALVAVLTRLTAPLPVAALMLVAGVLAAGHRTEAVAGPVLGFRYYGPIEGRIVGIDRSASDAVRLTLDRVVLRDVAPGRTPDRVRVSLHGVQGWITPTPGLTVILTGHLGPPQGPVEPGGFDFRRQAWFDGLGAVGYTRTPVLTLRPADEGHGGLAVFRLRMAISGYVQEALPGQAGAFASAITTGDRSGIEAGVNEDLRISNLAHLLAISGLHMGLLTGFVFAALRYGLALVPGIALHRSTKKIAAVAALAAGAFYLALSGGNVATERAFVMVAVMLVAVLFDRRALSLRSVALAALIVLALRPEALLGPGFQMSFAATTALVAVFGWMRDAREPGAPRRLPRWLLPVVALVVSSAVAGLATAPIAAAHFNRVPHYGLVANVVSVPLMGTVIIPAAVLAAILAPFGGAGIGLAIMGPAIRWILAVAHEVASWPGAVSHVVTPAPWVLPSFVLGALWLILWQGRARLLGIAPMALALALWPVVERPALLISDSGGLVGLMTEQGRVVSKARGDGFAAASWLENDGDGADQAAASARAGFWGEAGARAFRVAGLSAVHLSGRGAADRLAAACLEADLVILAGQAGPARGRCRVIDRATLAKAGAIAIHAAPEGLRVVSVADSTGTRRWNAVSQGPRGSADDDP